MRLIPRSGAWAAFIACLALALSTCLAAQQAAPPAAPPETDAAIASLPTHRAIMGLGKLAPAAEIAQGKRLFASS
ncbi:MAG: hypothetical protein ACRD13_12950, partial [Terriglobales bacterium]